VKSGGIYQKIYGKISKNGIRANEGKEGLEHVVFEDGSPGVTSTISERARRKGNGRRGRGETDVH